MINYLRMVWTGLKIGLFLTAAGWSLLAVFVLTFGGWFTVPVVSGVFLLLLSPFLLALALAGPMWIVIAPVAPLLETKP